MNYFLESHPLYSYFVFSKRVFKYAIQPLPAKLESFIVKIHISVPERLGIMKRRAGGKATERSGPCQSRQKSLQAPNVFQVVAQIHVSADAEDGQTQQPIEDKVVEPQKELEITGKDTEHDTQHRLIQMAASLKRIHQQMQFLQEAEPSKQSDNQEGGQEMQKPGARDDPVIRQLQQMKASLREAQQEMEPFRKSEKSQRQEVQEADEYQAELQQIRKIKACLKEIKIQMRKLEEVEPALAEKRVLDMAETLRQMQAQLQGLQRIAPADTVRAALLAVIVQALAGLAQATVHYGAMCTQ